MEADMKRLKYFLLSMMLLIPSMASAQWTFNPLYNVGSPTYTYDAAFQQAARLSQVPQPTRGGQQLTLGQPKRIDTRTVRQIDNRTDISGVGRFNIVERPGY